MSALTNQVLSAGKIPVIPTIPWSRDSTYARNIPDLNAQIEKLYRKFPQVVPGPDLYTYFKNNPGYISPDNVHPTDAGYATARSLWASVAARSIYDVK